MTWGTTNSPHLLVSYKAGEMVVALDTILWLAPGGLPTLSAITYHRISLSYPLIQASIKGGVDQQV